MEDLQEMLARQPRASLSTPRKYASSPRKRSLQSAGALSPSPLSTASNSIPAPIAELTLPGPASMRVLFAGEQHGSARPGSAPLTRSLSEPTPRSSQNDEFDSDEEESAPAPRSQTLTMTPVKVFMYKVINYA
jgi:hypothetical protein